MSALYACLLLLLFANSSIHVHGAPTTSSWSQSQASASALRPDGISQILKSNSTDAPKRAYSPLAGCESSCGAFLDDLKTCEDDSCICNQDGLNHFSEYAFHGLAVPLKVWLIRLASCATCDTRISTYRGEVNMTNTLDGAFGSLAYLSCG